MAISRAMRRLLQIREIEEQQSRALLESAQSELHRLEAARSGAAERGRRGWELVKASTLSGELPDRLSGVNEAQIAEENAFVLDGWIGEKTAETATLREAFHSKRVDRLQAETLIQETEASDKLEADRRHQQAIDDWHRTRTRGSNKR